MFIDIVVHWVDWPAQKHRETVVRISIGPSYVARRVERHTSEPYFRKIRSESFLARLALDWLKGTREWNI
jgi:hypothetical protein